MFDEELVKLKENGLYRHLRAQTYLSPNIALIEGREVILFSGNDYLGFSSHPKIKQAACEAIAKYGTSARASRLISGNNELYRTLEMVLAEFKGKEAAFVFPTGYHANLSLLTVLATKNDVIYMDKLSHASLYDGCLLSGAILRRYRHNDLNHLENLLAGEASSGRPFIVTEGVFSMDGDLAPLPGLKNLADNYGCLLLVDDAHGTGVLGLDGQGTSDHCGIKLEIEMGTLSKALGGLGGYVAGDQGLINFLINRARPFIFTTGLPPATLAGAKAAIELIAKEPWRRERVLNLAKRVRKILKETGYNIPHGFSPIVPIILGGEEKALALAKRCLKRGLFIPAIRTPAVPKNQARLRMTLSALHSDKEEEQALEILTSAGKELELI